jgi:hypothetical protein
MNLDYTYKINFILMQIKTFLLLAILSLTTLSVFGQPDYDTTKYKLSNNSYQRNWTFFTLTDTIEGIVVKHERQVEDCGVVATASLTIIKVNNDTIRVLNLCNNKNYSKGRRVTIIPRAQPKYQVIIPFKIEPPKNVGEKEKQKKIPKKCYTDKYDYRILKTTWGVIIKGRKKR